MDSGSAIPSTSRAEFYELDAIIPAVEIQWAFVRLLDPCWARQEQIAEESRTLAVLRDTLLPKLISGELRVKDADRFIEAAV
jgi:type I restriction enzyme S subunit